MRFRLGEIPFPAGAVVQLTGVPPLRPTLLVSDYALWVEHTNGYSVLFCMDWQLRKLDPPPEPASLVRLAAEELPA